MKIALINGSPKVNNSASGILLADLKNYLGEEVKVMEKGFHTPSLSREMIEELAKADVWVFAYPLYVDGIPGHLLSCLIALEKAGLQKPALQVYGIVNCGFYEGIQAQPALKLLQNWCIKTGVQWGGGIGIGGGGGLAMMPKTPPGKGPKAPIEKALEELSQSILMKQVRDNQYVSIAFPRFLYKLGAEMGWRQMIKANGGKVRDLGKRPDSE